MSNNFETTIFSKLEALGNSLDCMPSISVSSYILIDTLHSDFQSSAAISKHIVKMGLEAIVWSCFYSDTNSLRLTLLRVYNSFLNRG